jgi:hypothetical protein
MVLKMAKELNFTLIDYQGVVIYKLDGIQIYWA